MIQRGMHQRRRVNRKRLGVLRDEHDQFEDAQEDSQLMSQPKDESDREERESDPEEVESSESDYTEEQKINPMVQESIRQALNELT